MSFWAVSIYEKIGKTAFFPVSYQLWVFASVTGFVSVKSNSMGADDSDKIWKDVDYIDFDTTHYITQV